MAPGKPYHGPIFMAESRYAAPERKREVEALLASNPELKAKKDAKDVLATRAQIEAASNAERGQNVGVELTRQQNEAFRHEAPKNEAPKNEAPKNEAPKNEVAQYTVKDARTASTVAANTRQILTLIRESTKKASPETAEAFLKAADGLWQELEKVFEATQETNQALPHYLEKQKENVGVIAVSNVHEAYVENQQELDMQRKKLNLEPDVILGQQQAFKDYPANTNGKLQEDPKLQEHLSRMALEQGLLRTELGNAKEQLAQVQAAEEAAAKQATELKKEVEVLTASKKSLTAENADIRDKISDLDAKLKAAEQKAADYYEKELRRVSEQLQKEQQKVIALETRLKAMPQSDGMTKKEVEKAKGELKMLAEKYKNQAGEYGKALESLQEQTEKTCALEADVRTLQQQKAELEEQRSQLHDAKSSLEKQHDALKAELDEAKQNIALANKEVEKLCTELKHVQNDRDELEEDNNELMEKQKQHHKVAAKLEALEKDYAMLQATSQNLKSTPSAPNHSAAVEALKKELQDTKEKLTKSEESIVDWRKLGQGAYAQYQQALSRANALDEQLKYTLNENENLKVQAQSSRATTGGTEDAKYWKKRYNDLLAEL